ncbi:hypothetical protein J4526_08830 [Desulfurococcaceae archaeon MEX13E-LK6-19]|nr:hypothetical protein J4526_08830 [Desulfurococcaceae archaeon MEX13E-LK6-19]
MYLEPLGLPYIILMSLTGFIALIDARVTKKFKISYIIIIYIIMFALIYDAGTNLPRTLRNTAGVLLFMIIVSMFVPILLYFSFFEHESLHPWMFEQSVEEYKRSFLGIDIVYYVFAHNPRAVVLTLSLPIILGITSFFYSAFLWMLRDDVVFMADIHLLRIIDTCLSIVLLLTPLIIGGLLLLGVNTLWQIYGDKYVEKSGEDSGREEDEVKEEVLYDVNPGMIRQ